MPRCRRVSQPPNVDLRRPAWERPLRRSWHRPPRPGRRPWPLPLPWPWRPFPSCPGDGRVAAPAGECRIERPGGLHQFADRGQPRLAARGEHVENAPGDLAAEPFGVGRTGIGQSQAGPSLGQSRKSSGPRGIGDAELAEPALDLPPAHRAQSNSDAAGSNGWEQALLIVGAKDDRHSGWRLLEHLEKSVLGVVVEPMGRLNDDDPRPALNWKQRQFRDQVPDGARLRVAGLADPNLRAGSLGGKAMQVGVIARGHLPAASADAARPRRRIGVVAQQSRRQIQRERRLADRPGSDQQDGVRRPAEDHRIDLGQGAGLAARRGVLHGRASGLPLGGWNGRLLAGRFAAPGDRFSGGFGGNGRLAAGRGALLGRSRGFGGGLATRVTTRLCDFRRLAATPRRGLGFLSGGLAHCGFTARFGDFRRLAATPRRWLGLRLARSGLITRFGRSSVRARGAPAARLAQLRRKLGAQELLELRRNLAPRFGRVAATATGQSAAAMRLGLGAARRSLVATPRRLSLT